MLAEAINEQRGGDAEAINLVNSIRQRAGMPDLTGVSGQEDLRERIRNERRWELAMEGINLFDEMLWGTWKAKKFYPGNGTKEIWGGPKDLTIHGKVIICTPGQFQEMKWKEIQTSSKRQDGLSRQNQ
jgi:hypothetical protein